MAAIFPSCLARGVRMFPAYRWRLDVYMAYIASEWLFYIDRNEISHIMQLSDCVYSRNFRAHASEKCLKKTFSDLQIVSDFNNLRQSEAHTLCDRENATLWIIYRSTMQITGSVFQGSLDKWAPRLLERVWESSKATKRCVFRGFWHHNELEQVTVPVRWRAKATLYTNGCVHRRFYCRSTYRRLLTKLHCAGHATWFNSSRERGNVWKNHHRGTGARRRISERINRSNRRNAVAAP